MHKKLWHVYLCLPPQGQQWREKTHSSAGCDWHLESQTPATASATTTHTFLLPFSIRSYLFLDRQIPPINLDEGL